MPCLRRRSWHSPPLETGAGSGAASRHAQPDITPCPLLAAGLRGRLPTPRRLRGPRRQSAGVTAPKKTAICSQCGHRCRGRYDTRTCRARDLSAGGLRLSVQFERFRVHCPRCRNVFVERLDWLAKNPRFTQRCARHVGALCRAMTNTAVAQAERLHDSTVKDLDRIYMQQQVARASRPAPRAIGVDEIAIRKGHDYRLVVSDLDRRRPIWVGGTRAGPAPSSRAGHRASSGSGSRPTRSSRR